MFEAHSFMVLVAKRIDMLFSKQAKPVSATTRGLPSSPLSRPIWA